jgi:phage shock protein A
MTEMLDRAEDPARMIRMIILEMEETWSRFGHPPRG